ncbi:DUF2206 domain-containing protein [Halobacteriaceae archaeon GCM10025711]
MAVDERVTIALVFALALALATFETVAPGERYGAVRSVVGVLAALFAPGYLLLLVARIRCRRLSQLVLYAVGVSSAFLVGMAVVANGLLVAVGVSRPLDSLTWVLVWSLVVLSGLAYYRSNERPQRSRTISKTVPLAPRTILSGTLLVLLPLTAVAAASVMNGQGSNGLVLVLIGLLAGVVLFLAAGVIPRAMHPLAVWSVAISVLLQMTLVSPHLWGWDIHFQYATAHAIVRDGVWTPTAGDTSGSLLSITLLAAVYSSVTKLDLVWVYKLLYPFIASLLPVALYHLARVEFDDEWVAVLAPFALVFFYGFFKFMPDKQIVSQLFFVLVLVTMFDDSLAGVRKRALGVTFGAMMVLSHYGVSALFVAFLAATVVTVAVAERSGLVDEVDDSVVRVTFVTLLGVGWVGWYVFSASGVNFDRVVVTGYETLTAAGGVSDRSGVGYATELFASPAWAAYKLLNVALVGLISVGVVERLSAVVVGESDEPGVEYATFSVVVLGFLLASLFVTFGMGFDRTFLIALAVLAPFALVGLRVVFATLATATRGAVALTPRGTASVFAAFLAVFFLFSSGAAFAVAGDDVPSYSINLEREAGWPVYERSEVDATRWLRRTAPDGRRSPSTTSGPT